MVIVYPIGHFWYCSKNNSAGPKNVVDFDIGQKVSSKESVTALRDHVVCAAVGQLVLSGYFLACL